jgi:hypothetical protein
LTVRNLLWILSAFSIIGCAENPVAPPVARVPINEGVASALVFDPPITFSEAPIDLARDTRGTAAFGGFDEPSVDFVDVFTDDRQSNNGADFIHRDSISERVSAVHR